MESYALSKFSQRLKQLRKERGLSQEALALICNIDRTYVGRLESMKRNPTLEILYKIAQGLELKVADLIDF